MKKFNKILIANRGEIAVRIIRAARLKNIQTVSVYAGNEDPESLHITEADESFYLPGESISETYLNIDKIIEVARYASVDAVHPGYGFLAENPQLARACEKAGLVFIGPGPEVIRLMGNKIEARETVRKLGFPVIQGITGSKSALLKKAGDLAFPLMVKPAAGGGGKGMRIVDSESELRNTLDISAREANNYFGDPSLYLETYINPARHIEFQVLADHSGNAIHLNERECSVQRRYQKIIEECPSPTIPDQVRQEMGKTAVAITKEIGYLNAGTIEFLLDRNNNFYFLEMNTRIQVEHPVTEMVHDIDLVSEQLKIAAGNPLELKQDNIVMNGHAIEARIYAEDPLQDFQPSPGNMTFYREPEMDGVRIDAGQDKPVMVLPDYDPMVSKVIALGETRDEAKAKILNALHNYTIHGIKTNISYLQAILNNNDFRKNRIHTRFCEENSSKLKSQTEELINNRHPLDYNVLFVTGSYLSGPPDAKHNSPWNFAGYWRLCNQLRFIRNGQEERISFKRKNRNEFYLDPDVEPVLVRIAKNSHGLIELNLEGRIIRGYYSESPEGRSFVSIDGTITEYQRYDFLPDENFSEKISGFSELNEQFVVSPMYGKLITINVKPDDVVKRGEVLFSIVSMKMENAVISPRDATVKEVVAYQGKQVEVNEPVIELA